VTGDGHVRARSPHRTGSTTAANVCSSTPKMCSLTRPRSRSSILSSRTVKPCVGAGRSNANESAVLPNKSGRHCWVMDEVRMCSQLVWPAFSPNAERERNVRDDDLALAFRCSSKIGITDSSIMPFRGTPGTAKMTLVSARVLR